MSQKAQKDSFYVFTCHCGQKDIMKDWWVSGTLKEIKQFTKVYGVDL